MKNDGFMDGHRVARVLAVAVPATIFLLWWSVWGDRGEVVATDTVDGVIVEMTGRTCRIRAPEAEETRLLCPQGAAPGMTVRLNRMRYESGERRYAFAPVGIDKP